MAARLRASYRHAKEAERFLNGPSGLLQQLGALTALESLSDVERESRAEGLVEEKLLQVRIGLVRAAGEMLAADAPESLELVNLSLSQAEVEALPAGVAGWQAAQAQAAELEAERARLLEEQGERQKAAAGREVARRVEDPYLVKLRSAAGLPPLLSDVEIASLERKTIEETDDAPRLFELAALSYVESDGALASEYLARATEVQGLSSDLRLFAAASLERMAKPDFYEALGVYVFLVEPAGGFAQAGVREGDVVVQLGDEVIDGPGQIGVVLGKAAEPVAATVVRADRRLAIQLPPASAGARVSQLVILNSVRI